MKIPPMNMKSKAVLKPNMLRPLAKMASGRNLPKWYPNGVPVMQMIGTQITIKFKKNATDTHRKQPTKKPTYMAGFFIGAGEGNRTLVLSLGSFRSTIELHPHIFFIPHLIRKINQIITDIFGHFLVHKRFHFVQHVRPQRFCFVQAGFLRQGAHDKALGHRFKRRAGSFIGQL